MMGGIEEEISVLEAAFKNWAYKEGENRLDYELAKEQNQKRFWNILYHANSVRTRFPSQILCGLFCRFGVSLASQDTILLECEYEDILCAHKRKNS